jgi:hypothetical protein
MINLLGYGLLILGLINYGETIIPPRLTDPAWEFQTISRLVEQSAIALLGFVFAFYRPVGQIRKITLRFLGVLSYLCLFIGILYLLMLPLGVINTIRLDAQIEAQVTSQLNQQQDRLNEAKNRLSEQGLTPQQIEALATALNLPSTKSEEVEKAVEDRIGQFEKGLKSQAASAIAIRRQALLKQSVKMNSGATIVGLIFVFIWRLAGWTRRKGLR